MGIAAGRSEARGGGGGALGHVGPDPRELLVGEAGDVARAGRQEREQREAGGDGGGALDEGEPLPPAHAAGAFEGEQRRGERRGEHLRDHHRRLGHG